jgi:hypothetical protein
VAEKARFERGGRVWKMRHGLENEVGFGREGKV